MIMTEINTNEEQLRLKQNHKLCVYHVHSQIKPCECEYDYIDVHYWSHPSYYWQEYGCRHKEHVSLHNKKFINEDRGLFLYVNL